MTMRSAITFLSALAFTLPIVIGMELAWNRVSAADTGKAGELRKVGNIEFVYIPAGSFMMGSNNGDKDEKPVHRVTVDGFWIGKYEVTWIQYRDIMGKSLSDYKGYYHPVEMVSWNDAMKFCKKFSQKYNVKARLPYEAEWEYACRSGTGTKWYWGDTINNDCLWYDKNSGKTTHPVGRKSANAWGLHDMSGNVWEWCMDWYDEKYYMISPERNPAGPDTGKYRVFRGGSWYNNGSNTRSAFRGRGNPAYGGVGYSFRIVLSTH